MSRCFPYLPTGYLKQRLVESTKLEGEKFLPKTEQILHKRREKKGKMERKEKGKIEGIGKRFKKPDDCLTLNGSKEQLEHSDLTEEHGQSLCYLSDGNQNSKNKRKAETLSSSSECKINAEISNGKIKLRFSLKKPREPDAFPSEELVSSTSRNAEFKAQIHCCPSNNNANSIIHAPEQSDQISVSSETLMNDNGMKKEELLYRTLIEDWVPFPLEYEKDGESDDDWLFTKKHQSKRFKVENDEPEEIKSCYTALWPRADFLPGANLYALPYTALF